MEVHTKGNVMKEKAGKRLNPQPHNDLLRKRANKEIYLGIRTNINALHNWCPNNSSFILEHKISLYLGKIIFIKNKQGNLAPKFIPSNIGDIASQVSKINPLWLDEINKNYIPPKVRYDRFDNINIDYSDNNVQTLCKNSNVNITLNRDQIISYFTQLHQTNTQFIQNYIDSINSQNGIKAYHLHSRIYNDLLSKGILTKDMFAECKKNYDDCKYPPNIIKLATLDYLKKTNQSNFKIVLYDELFYVYFVWSLRNYTILYYQGYIAEKNNMLFNISSYIDDRKIPPQYGRQYSDKLHYKLMDYIDDIYYKDLSQDFKYEIRYVRHRNHKYGFFDFEPSNYIPTDEKGYYNINDIYSLPFSSPNQEISQIIEDTLYFISREKQEQLSKITPSPLGHYYFELSDNKEVYIEFFPRIYPSIDNPPQHWNKEMMKKLDLKLE